MFNFLMSQPDTVNDDITYNVMDRHIQYCILRLLEENSFEKFRIPSESYYVKTTLFASLASYRTLHLSTIDVC
jgi:hypothetical protein